MSFSKSTVKNGLLFSLIGLFLMGGWGVATAAEIIVIDPVVSGGFVFPQYECAPGADFYAVYYGPPTGNFPPQDADLFAGPGTTCGAGTGAGMIGFNVATPASYFSVGSYASGDSVTDWSPLFYWDGATVSIVGDTTTRIVSIDPEDGETIASTGTTTPVDFALHAYINEDDLSTFAGIKITFENIDQNVLLSELSQYTYHFVDRVQATTSGDFYYATTTELAAGNYRVTGTLERTTAFGVINPFAGFLGTIDEESHQFIVGTSTWIGNIQQNMFGDVAGFYGGLGATTSSAMAATCNPLSGSFGMRECMGFLLIPDSNQLQSTFNSFRSGVLTRAPWGYLTRFVTILSNEASTTLPAIAMEFDPDGPLAGVTWNVMPGEIIAAGGDFMNEVEDRHGNNLRDILEPIIKLIVGLALVFQIVHDLTGSHRHHAERSTKPS